MEYPCNVLVTGTTGFVGRSLTKVLLAKNYTVVASVRNKSFSLDDRIKQIAVGDLSAKNISWKEVLKQVDVVIHAAARVHIINDPSADALAEFRKVNSHATLNLAHQAVEAGVKRFIFISSIKVNGEITDSGQPFKPNDSSIPSDPYGLSKYEAEQALLALAKKTEMEVVIIRSPLVYGLGVKANFYSMMKWINKGIPLPFGAIHNQRSLIALDNLVSFINLCIKHPRAANEVFLISDREDVSTTELLQKVAKAFGKKAILIPVPTILMSLVAKIIGKGDIANRLFGSLQVDSSKAFDLLGWKPIITMDEQLKIIAEDYLNNEKTV